LIQEEIKRRADSGKVFCQNILPSRLLSKNIKIRIHKTIILPVVLCGYETWSLILREEHKLRGFENRVLRRVFRPKRDEVTRGWEKLYNEEHHMLYSSPRIIRVIKLRMMRCKVHVARMGAKRNAYGILMGNQKERNPMKTKT
jgi:hypothetical protein